MIIPNIWFKKGGLLDFLRQFQFGFAVQMWEVVEKPFICFFLAKTCVNMKFKTGETDFGYVQHTGFLTRPIRCAMHFSANGLGFGLAMDLPGDTLWIAAEVGSVDHKSLRQGLWSRLSRESPKTCICIVSVALGFMRVLKAPRLCHADPCPWKQHAGLVR